MASETRMYRVLKTEMCTLYRAGQCRVGRACSFAHFDYELNTTYGSRYVGGKVRRPAAHSSWQQFPDGTDGRKISDVRRQQVSTEDGLQGTERNLRLFGGANYTKQRFDSESRIGHMVITS